MKRILFLMSDTGGGHRAASRAIQAALDELRPGEFSYDMVDMWKDYTPYPLNTQPDVYADWVNNSPHTYAAQYWINDRVFHLKTISDLYCRFSFLRMKHLYHDHPCDIVVCVHSVFVRPAIYALRRLQLRMPFITVITDYARPPLVWYDSRVDRLLVPTEPAYWRGRALRIPDSIMTITGAPIHPRFTHINLSKAEARAQLGLSPDARIVLMVGGGDGMGPLVETARAVDSRPLNGELVIIAGRNTEMKAELESIYWQHKAHIYGFVDNMPTFMRAADLIITKAGPATITEAAAMGLPMIISGGIRYQETPNIDYVVERGAGIYAPGAEKVAQTVEALFGGDETGLAALAKGVTRIAEPEAIWNIAREILKYA